VNRAVLLLQDVLKVADPCDERADRAWMVDLTECSQCLAKQRQLAAGNRRSDQKIDLAVDVLVVVGRDRPHQVDEVALHEPRMRYVTRQRLAQLVDRAFAGRRAMDHQQSEDQSTSIAAFLLHQIADQRVDLIRREKRHDAAQQKAFVFVFCIAPQLLVIEFFGRLVDNVGGKRSIDLFLRDHALRQVDDGDCSAERSVVELGDR